MATLADFDLGALRLCFGCRTALIVGPLAPDDSAWLARAGLARVLQVDPTGAAADTGAPQGNCSEARQGAVSTLAPQVAGLPIADPLLIWVGAGVPETTMALVLRHRPLGMDVVLVDGHGAGWAAKHGGPGAPTHYPDPIDGSALLPASPPPPRVLAEAARQRLFGAARAALETGAPALARSRVEALLAEPGVAAAELVALTELARRLGTLDIALQAGRRALAAVGEASSLAAAARNNLGLVLLDRGETAAARALFEEALVRDPRLVRAWNNLAKLAIDEGRLADAQAAAQHTLRMDPENPHALATLGSVARRRHDLVAAAAWTDRARRADPGFLRAAINRALLLADRGALAEGTAALTGLADRHPQSAEIWGGALAGLHDRAQRPGAALAALERALALRPDDPALRAARLDARRKLCDWRGWSEEIDWLRDRIAADLARGRCPSMAALSSLRYPLIPAEQRSIAEAHARDVARRVAGLPRPPVNPAPGPRLVLGLLTHEFRANVVGHFLRHLPAALDRERFAVHAFVYNPDDGSAIRRDLEAGCDRVEDVTDLPVEMAAQRIADAGVHILIDINPYMQDGRPEIAALRPAPLQLSWLYPGTLGAPWIDGILVDEVVAPAEHQAYFSERLLHLPPCYLPATGRVPIAGTCPPRTAYGLPPDSFVFCSFNRQDKIDPEAFGAWMQILAAVPGSVLWLAADAEARPNLRAAAGERHVDPGRLVFADPEPDMGVHLARHAHADLFLDSFLHTAHVTAADALWAGLPLLTRLGGVYAGRVAASVLTAAGLDELIATDTRDFIAKAVHLAQEPTRLRAIRNRWQARRSGHRLFDATATARSLGERLDDAWLHHGTRGQRSP